MVKRNTLTNKEEGNQYDKIIKENILNLIPALLKRVVGLETFRVEDLPIIKLQTTLEREPDFLKLIYDANFKEGRIMQLEFESGNESYMAMRMLEYCGIIHRKFRKPVEQHLIFLGSKPSSMKTKIEFLGLSYEFKIHNLSEISYKTFINSNQPEEVILSILANKDDLSSEEIIQLILKRLVHLRGDSLATRKFIKQLEIISKLRNLQPLTTKTVDNMNISFDITTDVRFKQGLEKGIEQGAALKMTIAIINILKEKIIIDSERIALVFDVSVQFVETTKKALKKEVKINKALAVKEARINTIAKKFEVSKIFVKALKKLQKKKNK